LLFDSSELVAECGNRPRADLQYRINHPSFLMSELHSIIEQWKSVMPEEVRYAAASEAELQQFEAAFGPVPLEYRQFLRLGGGGAVGSEWVDGINQLPHSHAKFARERGPTGWQTDFFLIGWDGSGAPIGIAEDGEMLVEQEDGTVRRVATSFASFLAYSVAPT
jgi:hypothetical protein